MKSAHPSTIARWLLLAGGLIACSEETPFLPEQQSGGLPNTGGQTGSGGSIQTGGAGGAGGTLRSGGTGATGGTLDSGGTFISGGVLGTGGLIGTGGQSTGGQSTGGSPVLSACDPYEFPGYAPDLNYDFRDQFTDINPDDFDVYLGCDPSLVAGVKTKGWFAFIWGHDRNPAITDADIDRVLDGLNEDMAFARDVMGWPPDRLPQEGHFSNIYLFGSGLCTDDAPNTAMGGWQSGIHGYPMVLISWAPVVNYDRGGITHEEIHAVMSSMAGPKAPWFNEGGNTWLQMNMTVMQTGQYGVGFLDGIPFVAPHQPIECYSGWLQDGSFGGPAAEGVNQSRNGQQISTWRDYLGGSQYNSVFSHFLSEHVSKGANAWLWSHTDHVNVLESLASGLGEAQLRALIVEYRARTAMLDFGPWNDAFKVQIDAQWGRTVGAEDIAGGILMEPAAHRLTAYAATTRVDDTLTPEPLTLPGWSGANQIPLTVDGDEVRLEFEPLADNMHLQLAYRARDGSVVYGQPITDGTTCLRLDNPPRDGVVVAVVSNSDYLYEGDATRARKYDYRLKLVDGLSGTADRFGKYF